MSVRVLLAETRPWGVYQVFVLYTWKFETVSEKKKREQREEKQMWLIVMLNLRVSDTITMPTPAIAMETGFYCIDRLKKPPPPLAQVKCVVCTQPCAATCLVLSRALLF